MTFLKKTILAPFAVVALVVSVQAMAAPFTHTIAVEAVIPTKAFHVLPVGDWISKTQMLSYNAITEELSPSINQFSVINTAGAISGKLIAPAVLADNAGVAANIPLTVKFNGKTLSITDQDVLAAAEAATASNVSMEIAAVKPVAGYTAGSYSGNVQLSFDAVVVP